MHMTARLSSHGICGERWISAKMEFHFNRRDRKFISSRPHDRQLGAGPSRFVYRSMQVTWKCVQNWIYGFSCRRHFSHKHTHIQTTESGVRTDSNIYERPVATERWKLNATDGERTGNGTSLAHAQFYLFIYIYICEMQVKWLSTERYVVGKLQANVQRHVGAKWTFYRVAVLCANSRRRWPNERATDRKEWEMNDFLVGRLCAHFDLFIIRTARSVRCY